MWNQTVCLPIKSFIVITLMLLIVVILYVVWVKVNNSVNLVLLRIFKFPERYLDVPTVF